MQRLFDEHKFTRVAHLARNPTVDRSIAIPRPSCKPTCSARSPCCGRAGRLAHDGAARQRTVSARLDDEVYGSLARADPASRKKRPTAEFALCREQGIERSSGGA